MKMQMVWINNQQQQLSSYEDLHTQMQAGFEYCAIHLPNGTSILFERNFAGWVLKVTEPLQCIYTVHAPLGTFGVTLIKQQFKDLIASLHVFGEEN